MVCDVLGFEVVVVEFEWVFVDCVGDVVEVG